jgi:hypothetical protein
MSQSSEIARVVCWQLFVSFSYLPCGSVSVAVSVRAVYLLWYLLLGALLFLLIASFGVGRQLGFEQVYYEATWSHTECRLQSCIRFFVYPRSLGKLYGIFASTKIDR